jgi:hypothetical protein
MSIIPQAYLKQAPTGVPGDVTRTDESNVEPAMLVAAVSTALFPQAFGLAMVYNTGGISIWGAGNVQADFAGVLVREVPAISGYPSDPLTPTIPWSSQVQGMCVRGYISVVCQYGTPARGGLVYVNIQATAGRVLGGFEATSQGSYNIVLTSQQATWASDGMDANNNAELRIER